MWREIFPETMIKLEAVNQNFSSLGVQSEEESFKGHNEPDSTKNAVFFIGAIFLIVFMV